jgi:CubicO group peptidase (beta-lactamase class C family)
MRRIDAFIQSYIDNQAILGMAVAILQNGEIVYTGGFGTTSVEDNGVKVTPQTLFAYGSISKTICATLIMRLVEQDLLNLDTPLFNYLPDLQFSNVDYGRRITLRHLLSHTSGLPMSGKDWGPRDPDSLRRFVYEQIPRYTFLSEPGTVHLYSNTAFCIAGHVAEAVTGKYYNDLVREYVLNPLGMARTTFDPTVAMTYPIALPHEDNAEGNPKVIHQIAYNVSGNPSGFAIGSVSDLAHLAQMYLNKGRFVEQQFLVASTVAEMHKLHASRHIEGHAHPLAHVNQGYGLGFNIGNYKGKRATRHGGMSQSYNCFFDLFPDDRAGVVLLTNYSHDEPLMELVAALYDHALDLPHQGIVYLDKPAIISAPLDSTQLQRYAGTYLSVGTGDLAIFSSVENGLVLERQGDSMSLVRFGDNQFYVQVSERYRLMVAFISNSAEKVTHVMMGGEPYFPVDLDPAFQPKPHLWKVFEGVYKDPSNSNREEVFTVRLQNDVLFIAEGSREVPSKAISNNCFLNELGVIEFEDTQHDEVKILVLGKATRFYPLNKDGYHLNNVIQYLVEVPAVK